MCGCADTQGLKIIDICRGSKVQKHNAQLRMVFPNDAIQMFDIIVAVNDISDEAPFSRYLLRQIASDEWQGALIDLTRQKHA